MNTAYPGLAPNLEAWYTDLQAHLVAGPVLQETLLESQKLLTPTLTNSVEPAPLLPLPSLAIKPRARLP